MATVNLSKWRRSNPDKQYPKGRGGWMFLVTYPNDLEEMKTFCGPYTEARKQAVAYGKKVMALEVYLLP